MSRHARIEEISSSESDSDPDIMDPTSLAVLEPIQPRQQAVAAPTPAPAQPQRASIQGTRQTIPKMDHSWVTLYPLYFDAGATRAQGRRVGKSDAVKNPLAKALADALGSVVPGGRMQSIIFEPGKRHPADWSNPGRVSVKVRDESGRWVIGGVKNSKFCSFFSFSGGLYESFKESLLIDVVAERMLYKVVSGYLKKHPTTASDPFSLPVRGLPVPEGDTMPPPAVPRGWRINDILPLHSAAVTGGGVSDNIMKDIQAAMAGQDPAALAAASQQLQGKIESGKKEKKKDKGKKK